MKRIENFLDKMASEYGFYITLELKEYINQKNVLTANQIASLILIDEDMDIFLHYDMKKNIEKEFYNYFNGNIFDKSSP